MRKLVERGQIRRSEPLRCAVCGSLSKALCARNGGDCGYMPFAARTFEIAESRINYACETEAVGRHDILLLSRVEIGILKSDSGREQYGVDPSEPVNKFLQSVGRIGGADIDFSGHDPVRSLRMKRLQLLDATRGYADPAAATDIDSRHSLA